MSGSDRALPSFGRCHSRHLLKGDDDAGVLKVFTEQLTPFFFFASVRGNVHLTLLEGLCPEIVHKNRTSFVNTQLGAMTQWRLVKNPQAIRVWGWRKVGRCVPAPPQGAQGDQRRPHPSRKHRPTCCGATGQPWASAVRRFAPPRTRRDPRPYLKASRFAIAPSSKAGSIRFNPRGRNPAQNPRHPPRTKRQSH